MPKFWLNINKRVLSALVLIALLISAAILVYLFLPLTRRTASTHNVAVKQTTTSSQPKEETKFTFLAFGDSGNGSLQQKQIAKLLLSYNAPVTLHTGDNAYQSGTAEEVQKNVLEIYKDLFAKTHFYPSLGNHDYATKKAQPFLDAFELPGNERYYFFTYQNSLFIALDSNDPLNETPNQMLPWLEDTLKTNTVGKDWVIVYFHHPPYNSGLEHGNDLRVQTKIVPILEKYNVDLVLTGHEHSYQRTCPIRENKCVSEGIVYIVTGGGGGSLYKLGNPQWFTIKQDMVYHFVVGELSHCSLNLTAIDINSTEIDNYSKSKC